MVQAVIVGGGDGWGKGEGRRYLVPLCTSSRGVCPHTIWQRRRVQDTSFPRVIPQIPKVDPSSTISSIRRT